MNPRLVWQQFVARVRDEYRERPRTFQVGLAALALLISALGASFVVLPALAEERLRARLSELGLEPSIGSASVGFSGVSFSDLEVRRPKQARVLFSAARVDAELGWWRLGEGARAALDRLTVERAQLDLSLEDLLSFKQARRRAATEATTAEAAAARTPRVELRELGLRLHDEKGALLVLEKVRADVQGAAWEAAVAKVELGGAPSDTVHIEAVKTRGPVIDGRPVLAHAEANGAVLRWAAEGMDAKTPTTLARVLAARDALRGEKGSGPESSARAGTALWTRDARVELANMRVFDTDAEGTPRSVLEGLSLSVQLEEGEALLLEGKGKAPDSGNVSWKLRAWPREARVEGRVALHDVSAALFAPLLPRLPFFELEHTRVRADLELKGVGLSSVAVKGSLTLTDLAFYSEGLARTPVGPFSLVAQGEGTWTPARRELEVGQGQLDVGGVPVALKGVLAWPSDGYRVDIVAELAKTACARVLGAMPTGLLDELAAVQLSGDIAGKLVVHVDAENLDATKVDFDIDDRCSFVAVTPLLDLVRFQQPFMHRALEPDGTVFEMETGPGTPTWTPLALVSPFMVQAVIAHEDGRFLSHHGFAEPEIAVALTRNLKARAFRFGASTITMQLVKNVFLHRDKLLARKVQEAFITWWLEQQWDKAHILELYLNVIEYGPAIYGIRNAAFHYFGTTPMNLTPAQAAFLAMVLPNPKVFHEHYEKGRLSPSMKNRTAMFLKHMHARERIDDEALQYALEELESFAFYDPEKPPPFAPPIRGQAQPLPYSEVPGLDEWDTVEVPANEDGAYGAP